MDIEVRPCASVEELRNALNPISHYFGHENATEDAERFARWIEVERMHAAFLWASEGSIYGRFGYGLASRIGSISLPRERTGFAAPFEPRGTVRIVDLDEAVRTFPPLYEQVFKQRPGMNSRSKDWWETRRLFDDPARRQGGPKHRALLELDGEPAGYAIYNVKQDWRGGSTKGVVTLVEVVTPTPERARELWRWLLDFDWTSEFRADRSVYLGGFSFRDLVRGSRAEELSEGAAARADAPSARTSLPGARRSSNGRGRSCA